MAERWDMIIIGAGSAGMAAAIYAARFNLKVLMMGEEVGGLLNESHCVENYPGYKSISGLDLMMKFKEHADNLDVPHKNGRVTKVDVHNMDEEKKRYFTVVTGKGEKEETHEARTLLFATGARHKKLGAKGEKELSGKGVSYCATCDAAFFKNVPVCIIGGGDSAAIAGNLLKEFASKVYVIVRKDHMRAEPLNLKRLEDSDKVEILYETEVEEVLGENEVEKVKLTREHDGSNELEVNGMFVEIGQIINSELAQELGVETNDRGEIVINDRSQTSLPAVYAAGDVGNREYKQALTGASEGAVAAFSAYALLQKIDEGEDVEVSY